MSNELLRGKYRLLHLLGQGAMGKVWLAEDVNLERKVAIKQSNCSYKNGTRLSPARIKSLQSRAIQEAKILARLSHPNVVKVFDFFVKEEFVYLVMEHLKGHDLEKVVYQEQGPIPHTRLIFIFRQILDGMIAIHEAGIIHRDLKPSNIFLLDNDTVRIIDFGVARDEHRHLGLTKVGSQIGTPMYMSPEQLNGDSVTVRSDIFSLGLVLFFLATGQYPFTGCTSSTELETKIKTTPTPEPKAVYPGVQAPIPNIIKRATLKLPDYRYPNCTEFRNDLERSWVKPPTKEAMAATLVVPPPSPRPSAPLSPAPDLAPFANVSLLLAGITGIGFLMSLLAVYPIPWINELAAVMLPIGLGGYLIQKRNKIGLFLAWGGLGALLLALALVLVVLIPKFSADLLPETQKLYVRSIVVSAGLLAFATWGISKTYFKEALHYFHQNQNSSL
ncbi:MAG: serine/threonine-protein kinase [Bacteroidota bacterium]